MAKSYFAILGVPTDASAEEIRAAYRRLVKAYHPDHFAGGSGPFREIQEAYAILGDSRKRQVYQDSMDMRDLDDARIRVRRRAPARPTAPYTAPEPLVPRQGPGPLHPLDADILNTGPVRGFGGADPTLDDLLEWLFGRPFDPRRR